MKSELFLSTVIHLLLVGFTLFINVNGQESFKGITPLVTTKAEVEKLLGSPDKYGRYEVEEGRIQISYTSRKCRSKAICTCVVHPGTVESISLELYSDLYLKDLELDPAEYKETHSAHLNIWTYSNHKTGVVYEVEEGRVTKIYYNGTENACDRLKHPNDNDEPKR